jgi:hypothetical protein
MRNIRFAAGGIALPAALAAAPAIAQDVAVKPSIDARLRYENVEHETLPDEDADALTLRVRAGVQVSKGRWSALAEGQGTVAIVDHYYDGLHGAAVRPLIADPENIALYRAQLQYKADTLTVTAGRQRIGLDDDRFVDTALFRQNGQTYDAVRGEWTPGKLRADLTYAWSVRTVWGIDGTGARQQAVSGDNVFAQLGYVTPLGTLTGYAIVADQDEAAVQGFRLSSQTYGARFVGSRPIGKARLNYHASYARQTDYHRNPNEYSASFYLLDASLEVSGFKIGAGYEVLGADNGIAFTSFQFPVGSGFRYRGWAGKFVPNPPDGVRDLYGTVGWATPTLGPFQNFALTGTWHRFESDRLVRHYGNELDLLASAKVGRYIMAIRYAGYDADLFVTDTRKLWLQVDVSY